MLTAKYVVAGDIVPADPVRSVDEIISLNDLRLTVHGAQLQVEDFRDERYEDAVHLARTYVDALGLALRAPLSWKPSRTERLGADGTHEASASVSARVVLVASTGYKPRMLKRGAVPSPELVTCLSKNPGLSEALAAAASLYRERSFLNAWTLLSLLREEAGASQNEGLAVLSRLSGKPKEWGNEVATSLNRLRHRDQPSLDLPECQNRMETMLMALLDARCASL